MKHRKGLLSAFKKNGGKSKQLLTSAMSTARAFRPVHAPNQRRTTRPIAPTRAQMMLVSKQKQQKQQEQQQQQQQKQRQRQQRQQQQQITSPTNSQNVAASSTKKRQPMLYRYHAQAQEYEERLSASWDPLPGIRLFLDGEVVINQLRESANSGRENGALRMWRPSEKFQHVAEHQRLFPVLCEYLKTWTRRRSTPKQNELAIPSVQETDSNAATLSSNAVNVMPIPPKSEKTQKQHRKSPVQESRQILEVGAEKKKKKKKHQPKKKKKILETTPAAEAASSVQQEPEQEQREITPPLEDPLQPSSQSKQHEFEIPPPENSMAIPEGASTAQKYIDTEIVAYLSKSKSWYPGKLWYINLDGSFDIIFHDGDRRTCLPAPLVRWSDVHGSGVLPFPKPSNDSGSHSADAEATFAVGESIRARHRGGWKYFAGCVIKAHQNGSAAFLYDVKYDDDEIERNLNASLLATLPKHDLSVEVGQRLGLPKGKFVEAKYNKGKQWYRGNLRSSKQNDVGPGIYTIQYEDGEAEHLKRRHLWVVRKMTSEGKREIGTLQPGQKIQGRYGRRLQWFEGSIIQRQERKDAYDVVYADGDHEKGVPRWLLREVEAKAGDILVEGELIWTSPSVNYDDGIQYVYKMHEHEVDEKGSTEIYLYREDDPFKVIPLARLSISDDDVTGVLEAGGITEEQMGSFASAQDLCKAVSDMLVIIGGQNGGKFGLEIET